MIDELLAQAEILPLSIWVVWRHNPPARWRLNTGSPWAREQGKTFVALVNKTREIWVLSLTHRTPLCQPRNSRRLHGLRHEIATPVEYSYFDTSEFRSSRRMWRPKRTASVVKNLE